MQDNKLFKYNCVDKYNELIRCICARKLKVDISYHVRTSALISTLCITLPFPLLTRSYIARISITLICDDDTSCYNYGHVSIIFA